MGAEFADLQQRNDHITGPHGVVHNNHRCLSPGAEGAPEVRPRYPPHVSIGIFFKLYGPYRNSRSFRTES